MGVSVRRLVYRGRARDAIRDRIGLEDALGTTLPEDGRLVLVRKLTVRGEVADPHSRQDAVRRGWVEAVSDAVHATSSFAGQANCVWFASRAEAEAILLAKLLAGEPVTGWFWPLAVPDWAGMRVAEWLPRHMARILSDGDRAALVAIAQACVEADRVQLFIETADRASGWSEAGAGPSAAGAASPDRVSLGGASAGPEREPLVAAIAGRLLPRVLPVVWRQLITAIAQADVADPTKRHLAIAILTERVRRASPALALQPRLLREIAEVSFEVAVGRLILHLANSERADDRPVPSNGGGRLLSRREEVGRPAGFRHEPTPAQVEGARQTELRHRASSDEPEPADPGCPPSSHSPHAGLWLVVPSLIHLGFREWLTQQTELLGENPGHELLRAIALRHRVPPHDPALARLHTDHSSEIIAPWTETWRHALDGWLRHKARRRIHDLVSRPGTIVDGEERIDIRFPLVAADLRLRRLALDSDPGWTDWLGLSIRYHFDGGSAQ